MDVPLLPTGDDLRVATDTIAESLRAVALEERQKSDEQEARYLALLSDAVACLNEISFRLGLESRIELEKTHTPPTLKWKDEWRRKHSQSVASLWFHTKMLEVLGRPYREFEDVQKRLHEGKAALPKYSKYRKQCVSALEIVSEKFPLVRVTPAALELESMARKLELPNPVKFRRAGDMADGTLSMALQYPRGTFGVGCEFRTIEDNARARGLYRRALIQWIEAIDLQAIYPVTDSFGKRVVQLPPGEFAQGDLSQVLLELEALTGVRLKDGGNPIFLFRTFELYKKSSAGVEVRSFPDYCRSAHAGKIDVYTDLANQKARSPKAKHPNSDSRSKSKRGRPINTSADDDKRIEKLWRSGVYRNYEECARAATVNGKSYTRRGIELALQRQRGRKRRRA